MSYYGRPVLKAPVWRRDIPAYLFTGGLAAGSALLAAGADLTGRPALRRTGRVTALGATLASTYFLVNDLGRPERLHHMLRVAKPTSPMSMGSWILAGFGPAAGLAAASELVPVLCSLARSARLGPGRRRRPPSSLRSSARMPPAPVPLGRAAGLVAAALAPALGTYTAVLLADTAMPSWHEAYPELPFVFAGSALASAAGVGLVAVPPGGAGPARRLAVAGAALDLAASRRLEARLGLAGEPYRDSRLLRAARLLTAAGAAGAVLGRRSRLVSALSGAALVAGSVATRFGVFAAGVASAKDPRYTVEPQRARLIAKDQTLS